MDDALGERRIAEGAAATPYLTLRPGPHWRYPVAAGLWVALLMALTSPHVSVLALGVGELVLFVALVVQVRRHLRFRASVRGKRPPAEIRRIAVGFRVTELIVVVAIVVVRLWLGAWVAAGFSFVVVTAAFMWSGARYRHAVEQVRNRLFAYEPVSDPRRT